MLRFDKYEVVEKIGEGGFGIVYEGFDPQIRRRVAIKTCTAEDETSRQRFFREAEYAGNLHHRNITVVFDAGEQDGLPYMVQEYLSGEDLDRKIRRRDDLSFSTKLLYLIQIAAGIEHAHSRGVVHRDIKPANIRVLDDGLVKIMDFGIARSEHGPALTVAGQAVGTAGYLSPEQIRGQPADPRCDIHAFGVLGYELMSYRRAYPGNVPLQVMYNVLEKDPEPLAKISPEAPSSLVALLEKCYRKEPSRRYASFGEILAELNALNASGHPRPQESTRSRCLGRSGRSEPSSATAQSTKEDRHALTTGKTHLTGRPLTKPGLEEVRLQGRGAKVSEAAAGEGVSARARPRSALPYVAVLLLMAALGAAFAYWATQQADDSPRNPGVESPIGGPPDPGDHIEPATISSVSVQDPPLSEAPIPPTKTVQATLASLIVEQGWNKNITVSVSNQPAVALDRTRTFRLRPDVDHFLEFSLLMPGYEASASRQIRLGEGEERTLSPPIPRPGGLTVRAALRAPQVYVWIDGRPQGPTPIQGRLLSPGDYTITVARNLSSLAEAERSERISILSGRLLVVTFDTREDAEPTLVERELKHQDG